MHWDCKMLLNSPSKEAIPITRPFFIAERVVLIRDALTCQCISPIKLYICNSIPDVASCTGWNNNCQWLVASWYFYVRVSSTNKTDHIKMTKILSSYQSIVLSSRPHNLLFLFWLFFLNLRNHFQKENDKMVRSSIG